ncbi:MAG: VOC family protein [Candidatus Azotimanducaceae bacterium WSBS_2022_MAG_OTU7]
MKLDHIMFAVSDLDAGVEQIHKLTGVSAEFGGSHAGAGTRNALLSFGNDQYLEIIAPDPAQDVAGTMGAELLALPNTYIRTWAVATEDFTPVISVLEQCGYGHHIIEMSRLRPDGVQLAWQILFVTQQPHGLAMPFFINWLGSEHPARVAPVGCELESFCVQCPAAGAFETFCSAIDISLEVAQGDLRLSAQLQTPTGAVVLV